MHEKARYLNQDGLWMRNFGLAIWLMPWLIECQIYTRGSCQQAWPFNKYPACKMTLFKISPSLYSFEEWGCTSFLALLFQRLLWPTINNLFNFIVYFSLYLIITSYFVVCNTIYVNSNANKQLLFLSIELYSNTCLTFLAVYLNLSLGTKGGDCS